MPMFIYFLLSRAVLRRDEVSGSVCPACAVGCESQLCGSAPLAAVSQAGSVSSSFPAGQWE